ncbi:MAG TPA: xanthine dehydrogenase, partial [Firmicutes bacterium]|nr:xanthine dehydrogenase [Bacillota bacterium]
GAYAIANVKTDCYCVYTNNPVGGPLRGFGMCEMQWGIERQMDELAGILNIDPLRIRLINGMKDGSSTASGQTVQHVAFDRCLKAVAEAVEYGKKSGKYRGKGIAGMVKAPAQPSNASSSVIIRLNEDGTIQLLIGSTEMGQGTLTAMVQITAEALNIPPEKIELRMPDTDFTPYEWQSVGSRTIYSCGNAVLKAAKDVKDQLYALAGPALGVPEDELELSDNVVRWMKDHSKFIKLAELANSFKKASGEGLFGPIIGRGSWVPTTLSNLDPETGQGNPGLFWTFGATAAEVEIDPETGAINLLQLASVLDAGKAINLQLCKAQLNGGAIMGLGTALYEELKLDRGRVLNHNYADYKIPTMENVPEINCFVLETAEEGGPFGARGVGEPPMIGVAPAIANAVADAIGVEFYTFPITPERIVQALKEKANKPVL